MPELTEGWGLRGLKRKTHYYRNGVTLCGQGRPSDGVRLFANPDPWPCKTCLHIVENANRDDPTAVAPADRRGAGSTPGVVGP